MSISASGTVVVMLLFDRILWRWIPQQIVRHPKLYGTWKAQIEYEYPEGSRQTKDCYLVVRQTFSSITIVSLFDISRSLSRAATLFCRDGRYELWYVYWSEAHVLERGENPPHRGAISLDISVEPRLAFEGDYWTDRRSIGRIRSRGHVRRLYNDYEGARAAEYA